MRPSSTLCTASRVGVSVRRISRRSRRSSRRRRPTLRRARPDFLLELVDLVIEIVDQVEVALGDVLDEVCDEHADAVVGAARVLRGLRVEGGFARWRLRDRDEPLARRDEVDLLVVDAILVGDGHGHEEDAEDVRAVRDDPRPRLVRMVVPRGQRPQSTRVEILRQVLPQLLLVGVDQVDPPRFRRRHGRDAIPRRLRGAGR